jgi:hypothetical protein
MTTNCKTEAFLAKLKESEAELTQIYLNYRNNPESHPGYAEEWRTFWLNRYHELYYNNINPMTHDFIPEWKTYWTNRINELYKFELIDRKRKLAESFGLSLSNVEKNIDIL